jgi:hypothetical protein
MITNVINEYRTLHGRGWVSFWDNVVSDFCKQHCWAMAYRNGIYHAEAHFLNGWAEAVAMCSRGGENWQELEYRIIYEILGRSKEHQSIILDSSRLAYGVAEMEGLVWVTIRGQ